MTNPVNSDYCKQAQASQPLQSLRYISGLVYRMDYYASNMMDDFVNADIRTRGRRDSLINEWYFTPEGWEDPVDYPEACSGFVCKNEKGDLLFCRNFDGSDGDCVVLFDRVNGYKKVMLTVPYYSSSLYKSVFVHLSLVVLAQEEFNAVVAFKERIQMLLTIVPIVGTQVVLIPYVILCKT